MADFNPIRLLNMSKANMSEESLAAFDEAERSPLFDQEEDKPSKKAMDFETKAERDPNIVGA